MKPEFEVGDDVTFAPYNVQVEAVVNGVDCSDPDRIIYSLSGRGRKQLKTLTSGKSIVESRLYQQADAADWLK